MPAALRPGAILVLALGTFAVGTDAFIVAAFLPMMAADLGVSTAVAGHSVTAFALAYALLAPVIATLTTRIPRRTLLCTALALLSVANIGSALAMSMPWLIATRVAAAATAAAYTPNAGAVAATLVPPEFRARALAIVFGGLTVATALGVPLGRVASRSEERRVGKECDSTCRSWVSTYHSKKKEDSNSRPSTINTKKKKRQ